MFNIRPAASGGPVFECYALAPAASREPKDKTNPQNALETLGLAMLRPWRMGFGKPMKPARISCKGAGMRTTYLSTLLFAFCAVVPLNAATVGSGETSAREIGSYGQSSSETAPGKESKDIVIFKLGNFDLSSNEFASGAPKQAVNFVIGKSDPAKDWFANHPAVLTVASGHARENAATAPRAITFNLESPPAAAYRLHLVLLVESSSVPALNVNINGKMGTFYLQPKLDYSGGDQQSGYLPSYSSADVDFTFPGSYFRGGANTVTLQPATEAGEAVPDASINYDAVELSATGMKVGTRLQSTLLLPTIFFKQDGSELKECVEAVIRYGQKMTGGSADLTIANKHYRQELRGGNDFGEEKAEFLVSEFKPQTEAQLILKINGRQENYKQTIDPKKKWTLYLVPHIHLDVGYSDYQAKVAAIHARVIDEAMKLTAAHPDFRFSLDGSWDVDQYFKTRSEPQKERAIEAMQKKQLFVPAQYASLLTGIPTTETLIRSLYPSANLARRYGSPFNYANITDVPSYTWSYASILAAAGIHSLVAGSDNGRAPVLLQGRLNERSPTWWVGPDGKKVLLWYSRIYQQMQALFGLPPVLSAGRETLPLFLQMYEGSNYHSNATILFGTQVENTDLFPQQAELAGKWNNLYAYPHMQYSGFDEALSAIEAQFGDTIPTIRGDGGPYWEDGAGSDAYYLAMERWTEARGQTAEKLATLSQQVNPVLKANTSELGQMWTDMVLMDEHTWGAFNSVTDPTSMEAVIQLPIKDQFASSAAAEADFVTRRSMEDIADVIPVGTGSIIVFNSLNWKRNGAVAMDLDKGQEIVDSTTNQPVPIEVLSSGDAFRHIRFTAQDVPALGYKVYSTRKTSNELPASKPETSETMESPYYKVQLDAETGAVRSIYDKQLQRELVSQDSPYRFGEYLYVTGGDKTPNTIQQYDRVSPKPELTIHPSGKGKIVSVERTPSGQVAHLESTALNTPSIKTEIRLFDNEKKLELIEDVDKTEVLSKEAAYFAFPFDLKKPQFQYEIQNGVIDPSKDLYAGAGYEWFTAQHWVSVQQDGTSGTILPLDAPLVTLGDINHGLWPEKFGERPGTVFSYAMNNYWFTNYRASQGGHFTFHYLVTSAPSTDSVALSRMGWEEITPLEANIVTSQDKAAINSTPTNGEGQSSSIPANRNSSVSLDAKQQGFLEVDDPNVLLETMKPAEDGMGTILRFLDFGGTERSVTVRIPSLHLVHAWQTDAVERNQGAMSIDSNEQLHFTMHPNEIITIRVTEPGK